MLMNSFDQLFEEKEIQRHRPSFRYEYHEVIEKHDVKTTPTTYVDGLGWCVHDENGPESGIFVGCRRKR